MSKRQVLEKITQLAKSDIVVDTFLKLAIAEIQSEITSTGNSITPEGVEEMLLGEKFYKLIYDIISVQTKRVSVLENELSTNRAMG